jgi:ABC-type Co2+ transport system permease subunit
MSFDPVRQPINPFKLLGDSLSQVAPIYLPSLIIASPIILINVVILVLPKSLSGVISLIYTFLIAPLLTGIITAFIYSYLKRGTIDLRKAAEAALSNSGQLIFGMILYGLAIVFSSLLLLIPGIYLVVRWRFFLFAVILNNCSAMDGFKYSSKLVKGRWWQVLGSMLLVFPIFIIVVIVGAIFGSQSIVAMVINTFVQVLFTPPFAMYHTKLYLRLQEIADLQSQS